MKFTPLLLLVILFACGGSKQETPQESNGQEAEAVIDNDLPEEPPITNPANIIDYFALLQWKNLVDDIYIFVQHDGKYVCVENLGDEFDYSGSLDEVRLYPSTVDIRNGYLNIEDEGTGEGLFTSEVALFKKSDNAYVIAVSGFGSYPPHMDQYMGSTPRFFLWQNSDFVDVSKDVLPAISVAEGYNEYYRLPQVGRVIKHTQYSADTGESITTQFEFDSPTGRFILKD
ncbi:MAG TPA: hypothetical protein P5280_01315 [Cyclobacteriaceae bacterium]|nr:hypothetical protein [Cyclobacteriaceae bacterium]